MRKKETTYGKGFNAIGARFTLIYLVLAAICLVLVAQPFTGRLSASDMAMHVGLASFGLCITAGLMLLLSRNLSEPIRQLTEIARRIAEGDLDVKIPLLCKCEIGGLAASMRLMVKRLRTSTAENRQLANHDLITGLPNRYRLQTLLERRVGSIGAEGQPARGAVFFIDILELRKVNDRFGHEASDKLLKSIAHLLVAASPCRNHDENLRNAASERFDKPVLARFGGTELVLTVPDLVDPIAIGALADRLHMAVAGIVEEAGRQFRPKIAIGIAIYPDHSNSAIKVKQYAALACNHSLALPILNKTALFEADMMQAIKTRESIERYLRTAIAERQFEVYYQPKVSARDWTVTGVEALVRLNHPDRGVVGPGEFIPVAEMAGLIGDIGLIVLDEAIAQCAAWIRDGQTTEVSVNVSVEQFQNAGFSDTAIALLERHDCPAHLITIEITETLAASNVAGVASQIAALRAAGLRIAIDDFGTGYSNLVQLTGLKFDILKVDRSFVTGIDSAGSSREVSRAIIQLGKNLGCKVVVEGTDTPGQVAAAAHLGCDEIQGFYFSKPMKRCDFETWRDLRSKNTVYASLDALVTRGVVSACA
ncbi:MAG: EAL domain-containing protein [Hoeflea sp.]|uniref:putative bifunctional diguanylate cyclase/phosphodiesterase n=1 Tax=Hoeflea sp. TaxID=1940281 RepID=UPI001D5E7D85|nr:GGDEF domain-containing phosphodiesterase [Hoeflea sp.]MBU4528480.1 EAL domain-containing protein [Alphaproteobacteria bacterium]MBU4544823.1 EAL domain-containing protein [Alphaproteobacteria bacterium]MBU4551431.1 EAL domain-containing protein [Alphaproteobacteria bacterium]MBV1721849.1 EAL domain-containing protein [Hoeflea sp.]MBV1762911.1 EAL domain-containing protein [Hoeflea sp.]